MIPAGRTVIDLHGIGGLHKLSPANAKREKPWAGWMWNQHADNKGSPCDRSGRYLTPDEKAKETGKAGSARCARGCRAGRAVKHPEPLTTRKPTRGHPQLWDEEQATAYAERQPVPPLPRRKSPDDLLDRFEAAELAELDEEYWKRRHLAGEGPPADAEPYGVPHWTRRTVLADKAEREKATDKGGRPSTTRQRVRDLLEQAARDGKPRPTAAELAETLGVHRTTVERHLNTITGSTTTT